MSAWVPVGVAADLPPGAARECVVADRVVALFNVEGQFFAIDGICPHQGGPLGKGQLSGCLVTCPWHGWQFDVTTGQHQTSKSLVHPQFATKVEDGQIFVRLPE
jgi:nitrite reductase/ring-hydroxylating ferredoxin subunit